MTFPRCPLNICNGFTSLMKFSGSWDENPSWLREIGMDDMTEAADAGCRICQMFIDATRCFSKEPAHFVSLLCVPGKAWDEATQATRYSGYFNASIFARQTIKLFQPVKEDNGEGRGGGGYEWSLLPPLPERTRDSSLDGKLKVAKGWLGECRGEHKECGRMGEEGRTRLPKRVLDLFPPSQVGGEDENGDKDGEGGNEDEMTGGVRLYESTAGETGEFIALSHRWGETQPLTTTKATLDKWKKGIPWVSVPHAFQDAITVARKLGVRYLWIDSLCIIQDDRQDWAEQAPEMCSIYSNAFLTISATRCDEGCTDTLFPDFQRSVTVKGDGKGKEIKVAVRVEGPHVSASTHYPLLQRAWVFQERLLSRRILHFGFDELNWECMERAWCECDPNTSYPVLPHLKSAKSRNPSPLQESKSSSSSSSSGSGGEDGVSFTTPFTRPGNHKTWREMIYWYTQQQLTFQSDRGPAILGLAREMAQSRPKDVIYLSGLWSDSLIGDLAWEVTGDPVLSPGKSKSDERLPGPTWSWTTVPNAICLWPLNWEDNPAVEILDLIPPPEVPASSAASSTMSGEGRRAAGSITLRGKVVRGVSSNAAAPVQKNTSQGQYLRTNGWFEASFPVTQAATGGGGEWFSHFVPDFREGAAAAVPEGGEVFWLSLGTNPVEGTNPSNRPLQEIGLVLRCVDTKLQLYERVGLAGFGQGRGNEVGGLLGEEMVVCLV